MPPRKGEVEESILLQLLAPASLTPILVAGGSWRHFKENSERVLTRLDSVVGREGRRKVEGGRKDYWR